LEKVRLLRKTLTSLAFLERKENGKSKNSNVRTFVNLSAILCVPYL
jgi:hypothetical protein